MSRSIKPALQRLGLAAAAAGLLLPTSSLAVPPGGVNRVEAPSPVTRIEYRCWWSYGARRCAWFGEDDVGPRVYGYYYGPYGDHHARPRKPEAYRPGSQRWWDSMRRWGRTGSP